MRLVHSAAFVFVIGALVLPSASASPIPLPAVCLDNAPSGLIDPRGECGVTIRSPVDLDAINGELFDKIAKFHCDLPNYCGF